MKTGITEDLVRQAMATVIEPELHRDLITLDMVHDIIIDGNNVTLTIMLTTPACPLKGKMEHDTRAALGTIDGIGAINVKWDSKIPQDQRISQTIGQNFKGIKGDTCCIQIWHNQQVGFAF